MPTDKQIEAAMRHLDQRAEGGRCAEMVREMLEAAEHAAWEDISTAPRDGTPMIVVVPIPHSMRLPFRRQMAQYIPRYFERSSEDFAEYCVDRDEYYTPEGWYEVCYEHDEFMSMAMSEPPTHWRPLPAAPEASDGE